MIKKQDTALIGAKRNLNEGERAMFGNDGDNQQSDNQPIHTEKVVADRKIFFLDLKENDRGQFVKITEDVRGRRDTIMVPGEILDEFIDALIAVREAADE